MKLGVVAFTAVIAVLLSAAGPAAAKGAVSVTITGPGIPLDGPIEVSGETHPDEWGQVDTGLWEALPDIGPSPLASEPPAGHVGLRHTLTWQVSTGPDETTPIRQDLYLHAEGGPLVYTAPGQPIGDEVTRGGWYRAPGRLRQVLADACVPIVGDFDASVTCWKRRWAAKAASASATSAKLASGGPAQEAEPGDSVWSEPVAGMVVLLAGVGVGGAVAVRRHRARRRERVAPVPL
ncbi:MAG: hypothetical protein ACRD07_06290 [Acidimicrobiales bacterium]